eukprot:365147-Chlamydomonas_euryale.AAC.1
MVCFHRRPSTEAASCARRTTASGVDCVHVTARVAEVQGLGGGQELACARRDVHMQGNNVRVRIWTYARPPAHQLKCGVGTPHRLPNNPNC